MSKSPTKPRRSLSGGAARRRKRELKTAFRRCDETLFEGYALDPSDLARRYWIDILLDGVPVKTIRAQTHVPSLSTAGYGDGCYGFTCIFGSDEIAANPVVEARLTNIGAPVGHALSLRSPADADLPAVQAARVRWLGGLRIDGEVEVGRDRKAARNYRIQAHAAGEVVAEVEAHAWASVKNSAGGQRWIGSFDLHLPVRFADGRLHHIRITTHEGEELNGSPLTIIAFKDGLRALLAGKPGAESALVRANLFDRLVPMSIPFASYPEWRERFRPEAKNADDTAVLVLLLGDGDVDATLRSLEEQSHQNWIAAAIPVREAPLGFDPQDILTLLTADAPDRKVVVASLAGAIFATDALARLCDALARNEDAVAAYGDIEIRGENAHLDPLFLSAFDYERMLEQGYCAYLFVTRREQMIAAVTTGASTAFRLFSSLLDARSAEHAILHVPYPLAALRLPVENAQRQLAQASAAHLKARGTSARMRASRSSLFPAVRITRIFDRNSKVAIVIPTRNRVKLLQACVETVLAADRELVEEIIVVDNGSSEADALAYLKKIDGKVARVLRIPGPFNYSLLNNRAVEMARADNICLLNNDIEVVSKDWLAEMSSRLADREVGAVGALLLWPNGAVQHGGTIVGTQMAAAHAFNNLTADEPGYGDLLLAAHECSAVTAACMLTRRSDYLAVGGLDEIHFPVNFNDVDYCLKLRARGRRIVFTPHARLIHHESASRGADSTPDRSDRHRRELTLLRTRWGDALFSEPYYNPGLALDPVPFGGLAWPPRPFHPRFVDRPKPVDIPPGF